MKLEAGAPRCRKFICLLICSAQRIFSSLFDGFCKSAQQPLKIFEHLASWYLLDGEQQDPKRWIQLRKEEWWIQSHSQITDKICHKLSSVLLHQKWTKPQILTWSLVNKFILVWFPHANSSEWLCHLWLNWQTWINHTRKWLLQIWWSMLCVITWFVASGFI